MEHKGKTQFESPPHGRLVDTAGEEGCAPSSGSGSSSDKKTMGIGRRYMP